MKQVLAVAAVAALLLVALLLAVSVANARKVQPFGPTGGTGQLDRPIEEQNSYSDCCTIIPPEIDNPYANTYWDINDHMQTSYGGAVPPGSAAVQPVNIVWDPNPLYSCRSGTCGYWSFAPYGKHFYTLDLIADSPSLTVTVCFTPQGRCFTPQPVWNGLPRSKALWRWTFHGRVVYAGNPVDPAVGTIPDSNGGIGVLSQITGTITNTGSGTATVTTGVVAISSDVFGPCSYEAPCAGLQSDYPFTWSSS